MLLLGFLAQPRQPTPRVFLEPRRHVLVIADGADREPHPVRLAAREQQHSVPQHPVAEQRRRSVEHQDVQQLGWHDGAEPPGEAPHRAVDAGGSRPALVVDQDGDVEVAARARSSPSAAAEQVAETHFRQGRELLPEGCADRIDQFSHIRFPADSALRTAVRIAAVAAAPVVWRASSPTARAPATFSRLSSMNSTSPSAKPMSATTLR